MKESIPDLDIEFDNNDGDGLILLGQDQNENRTEMVIHLSHLRYMAERFGLVSTSAPEAHKTIAMLTRRLQLLRARIGHVADCLEKHPSSAHIDLSYEQIYARATADIANEFCADDLSSAIPGTAQLEVNKNEESASNDISRKYLL